MPIKAFTDNIEAIVHQNNKQPVLVRYEERLMPETRDRHAPPTVPVAVPIAYIVYQYGCINGKIGVEEWTTYLPVDAFVQKIVRSHPKRSETDWELQSKRMRFIRGEAGVLYMHHEAITAGRAKDYKKGVSYHRSSTLNILTGQEIEQELNGQVEAARRALGLEK